MSTRHSFLSTTGLIRAPSPASAISSYSSHARPGGTNPGKHTRTPNDTNSSAKATTKASLRKFVTRAGVVPLGPTFLVVIAVLFSLVFIGSISFAFVGSEDEPIFKDLLDDVAQNSPGIVLIGDNVDVDIDEPAITIRWSILACGKEFVLSGSEGTHGSDLCGVPSMPLNIYVDGDENPTAIYNPENLPFVGSTGQRRNIQNLFQFDSDHVLDIHEARLYPFDTYHLTSTIHAVSTSSNDPVPIMRLPTMTQTSSFVISSSDAASYTNTSASDGISVPSRDIDMRISRPGEAKAFALVLFAISWMLAHATIASLVLAWKTPATEKVLKYLAFVAITLLLIPQLRNAMPDAPGFDGVLIDSIGFFPQMLMTGFSIITILASIAQRELHSFDVEAESSGVDGVKEAPAPLSQGLRRLRSSASLDFRNLRSFSRNFVPPSPIVESQCLSH